MSEESFDYSDDYSDDFDQTPKAATPAADSPAASSPPPPPPPPPAPDADDSIAPTPTAEPTASDPPPAQTPDRPASPDSASASSSSRSSTPPARSLPDTPESGPTASNGFSPVSTPPARAEAKEDASVDSATEEELSEIKVLKKANEGLRQQLLSLNGQLDDALNQRGEKIVQITRMQKVQNQDVDKLQKDIDRLRRANTKLNEQLRQSDAAGRLAELQNVLNEKLREVEVLKEDNRSLENVHRNQAKKLQSVEEVEARINAARDQHLEEVRQTKDKITELKHLKENDEKTMKQQQQQINVLQMKIRAANQSKVNPKAIADLDKKLKEKAHVVESLRYEVGNLTKSNEGEKKRLREQMKGSSAELRSLQQEAERLRALMAAQDAEPFPSLTNGH